MCMWKRCHFCQQVQNTTKTDETEKHVRAVGCSVYMRKMCVRWGVLCAEPSRYHEARQPRTTSRYAAAQTALRSCRATGDHPGLISPAQWRVSPITRVLKNKLHVPEAFHCTSLAQQEHVRGGHRQHSLTCARTRLLRVGTRKVLVARARFRRLGGGRPSPPHDHERAHQQHVPWPTFHLHQHAAVGTQPVRPGTCPSSSRVTSTRMALKSKTGQVSPMEEAFARSPAPWPTQGTSPRWGSGATKWIECCGLRRLPHTQNKWKMQKTWRLRHQTLSRLA